jgi:hypothetical protein
MDIRVTDVDRVRSAAESRGRLMDDNVVALGGIRIRLVPA